MCSYSPNLAIAQFISMPIIFQKTEPTPMPKNLIIGTENMLPNVHKALSWVFNRV